MNKLSTFGTTPRPSFWARLGSFAYQQRRWVLGAWIVLFVAIGAAVSAVGTNSDGGFETPDSESTKGFDIVKEHFGESVSFLSGSIVFEAPQGVADPTVATIMGEFIGFIDSDLDTKNEYTIVSPYSEIGRQRGLVSPDGTIAKAEFGFVESVTDARSSKIGRAIEAEIPALQQRLTAAGATGVRVELGGQALGEFEPPDSELLGVAFAVVILILAFGSVLAMGLSIGTALFGVGIGIATIQLLTNVLTIPDFATTLGAMIGLGVGIDYALFIVTRYREGLRRGLSGHDATVEAIDTAGRAVIFAGLTVVISLLGMYVMGLRFVSGLATGAAVTVAITMAASVTLLPAFIGFAKRRVEVTRRRGVVMSAGAAIALLGGGLKVAPLAAAGALVFLVGLVGGFLVPWLRQELPPRKEKELRQTWAYRWSHFVQRHPWAMAIGTAAVLLVMALPVLGIRLGFSDESTYSKDTTTRQAYDLLTKGFGPGSNGPLLLTGEIKSPAELGKVQPLVQQLASTNGVATALGPIPSKDGAAFQIVVIPTTGPQEKATADLVTSLRNDVIPGAIADGPRVFVTGSVASSIDFSSYLGSRLPWFFVAVLSLSFLLLMTVFRSVLVPLKAVIMNLLSIGAAYGVVVAVFQWGWGLSLFGTSTGPIEPFIPMMLFAIVFGLSMDYEVFLLSRVREEYDRTGDPVNSVADGLAATARVITAAAMIMVVVFGSFVLEDNRVIKLFGLGLAVAVLLDATLIRMLLVPATMELLGAKNWWLPKWLDKLLPKLNIEGSAHTASASVPTDPTAAARELVRTGASAE